MFGVEVGGFARGVVTGFYSLTTPSGANETQGGYFLLEGAVLNYNHLEVRQAVSPRPSRAGLIGLRLKTGHTETTVWSGLQSPPTMKSDWRSKACYTVLFTTGSRFR